MVQSKVIDKEQLTAFERWEVPAVSAAGKDTGLKPLTAVQIEALQKQAYDEAYQQGLEAGRRDGREAGMEEMRVATQRVEQIVHALAEPLADVDKRVEEEMVTLAIAIARQLIRRELQANPDEVVAVVREALAALPSSARHIKIFLHPDDSALIMEALSISNSSDQIWQVIEDPVLTRGGCRVEADHSRIDATVEKRLNSVVAELFGGARSSDPANE
jgi:flagellar assembly protein FliH